MKKILCGLCALIICLTLTGCGKDKLAGKWVDKTDGALGSSFKFDGKGKVTYDNDYIDPADGTYTIDGNKVTITLKIWDKPKVYEFKLKDNSLSFKNTDGFSPDYDKLVKE